LFSPAPGRPDLSSGLTSFLPSADPARARDQAFVQNVVSALWDRYRIYVRTTLFPAYPADDGATLYAIRASTSLFNDAEQVDALVRCAAEIAKE